MLLLPHYYDCLCSRERQCGGGRALPVVGRQFHLSRLLVCEAPHDIQDRAVHKYVGRVCSLESRRVVKEAGRPSQGGDPVGGPPGNLYLTAVSSEPSASATLRILTHSWNGRGRPAKRSLPPMLARHRGTERSSLNEAFPRRSPQPRAALSRWFNMSTVTVVSRARSTRGRNRQHNLGVAAGGAEAVHAHAPQDRTAPSPAARR